MSNVAQTNEITEQTFITANRAREIMNEASDDLKQAMGAEVEFLTLLVDLGMRTVASLKGVMIAMKPRYEDGKETDAFFVDLAIPTEVKGVYYHLKQQLVGIVVAPGDTEGAPLILCDYSNRTEIMEIVNSNPPEPITLETVPIVG